MKDLQTFLKNNTGSILPLRGMLLKKRQIFRIKMMIVRTGGNSGQNFKISECLEINRNRMKESSSLRAKLSVHQNI